MSVGDDDYAEDEDDNFFLGTQPEPGPNDSYEIITGIVDAMLQPSTSTLI